jgi:hypothetical protein
MITEEIAGLSQNPEDFAIILDNCDKLDLLDIEDELEAFNLTLQVVDESEHRYGEPGAVILVVVAGSVALSPLLLWLANHAKGFRLTEQDVTLPGGREMTSSLKVVVTDFGPPTSDELRKLSKFPGTDPAKIAAAYAANQAGNEHADS